MRYIVLKEFAKFRFAFFAFLIAVCFCLAWIFFEIKGGLNKFGNAGYAIQILFNKKVFLFINRCKVIFIQRLRLTGFYNYIVPVILLLLAGNALSTMRFVGQW